MKTDVLVIGSGIAGLYFALKCAAFAKVTLATKDSLKDSNTAKAQGGIAAVIGLGDSAESHYNDTLIAGAGLCNEAAVRFMVNSGPACIYDLEQLGVEFTEDEKGWLHLALEGGHSTARVVHVNDQTGAGVINTLINCVRRNPAITVLENHFAIDLIVQHQACCGAYFIDESNTGILPVQAGITMLASGGAGQVYEQNTNPFGATGDGFAMAWRAGAVLQNMEFVQFHPTMLYTETGENFLISEALRGFGAELVSTRSETFMHQYHPMGSLAPRDIVARAITAQMQKDGSPCVYLDTPKLDAEALKERFPAIYINCLKLGIDITKQPIPVIPAAHYMCGGVETNLQGQTNIPGLYVCGETACTGVHGANRLASNSLLEGLVFAQAASLSVAADQYRQFGAATLIPSYTLIAGAMLQAPLAEICAGLRQLMWEKAGIMRNEKLLNEAIGQLAAWEKELNQLIQEAGINRSIIETLNMVQTAKCIAVSAINRQESRGAHYRSDFPAKSTLVVSTEMHNMFSVNIGQAILLPVL